MKKLSFARKFKIITGKDFYGYAMNLDKMTKAGEYDEFTEMQEDLIQGAYLAMFDFEHGKERYCSYKVDGMLDIGDYSEKQVLDLIKNQF